MSTPHIRCNLVGETFVLQGTKENKRMVLNCYIIIIFLVEDKFVDYILIVQKYFGQLVLSCKIWDDNYQLDKVF
jgi:hypothetical protein